MLKLTLTPAALPPLPRLDDRDTRAIVTSAANAVAGEVKANFVRLASASGSRYYWHGADAGTRVSLTGDPTQAAVTVHQVGVRLHYYGGTVRPTGHPSEVTGKPTKSLLIPFEDSPLRRRRATLAELGYPREQIRVIKSRGGCPILIATEARKRKSNIIYLGKLVKSATFRPRPDVLPAASAMQAAMLRGAIGQVEHLLSR